MLRCNQSLVDLLQRPCLVALHCDAILCAKALVISRGLKLPALLRLVQCGLCVTWAELNELVSHSFAISKGDSLLIRVCWACSRHISDNFTIGSSRN